MCGCLCHGPSPQLTKEEETFAFTATQDFPVRNLQPATVTLYDYYETGEPRVGGHAQPRRQPLQPPRLGGSRAELSAHADELWLITGSSSP